jgi:hypothetical protein
MQAAILVKKLLRFVGTEPFLKQLEVLRIGADFLKRYLMSAPCPFDL